jgi:hypothetical protein
LRACPGIPGRPEDTRMLPETEKMLFGTEGNEGNEGNEERK